MSQEPMIPARVFFEPGPDLPGMQVLVTLCVEDEDGAVLRIAIPAHLVQH